MEVGLSVGDVVSSLVTGDAVGSLRLMGEEVGSGVGKGVGSIIGSQISLTTHSSVGLGYHTMQHCSRASKEATGSVLSSLVHPADAV